MCSRHTKSMVQKIVLLTSYELEHDPRKVNQAKHYWEAKAMHDEYSQTRYSIKCWL